MFGEKKNNISQTNMENYINNKEILPHITIDKNDVTFTSVESIIFRTKKFHP